MAVTQRRRFKLELKCGRPSFGETQAERNKEIARILRAIADKVESSEYEDNEGVELFDVNGNHIGAVDMPKLEG